jgi:hypothetical protein
LTGFIWAFPSERLFATATFPQQFVSSPDEMRVDPSELAGSRVWLLARSAEGYLLFGHLVIETVSLIEGGRDKGFFILEADRSSSFRILPHDRDSLNSWIIRKVTIGDGIWPCSDELESLLIGALKENQSIMYGLTRRGGFNALPKPPSHLFGRAIGRHFFQEALSRFALGELAQWEKRTDLSPYGIVVLVNCSALEYGQDAINEFTLLDSRITSLLEPGGFDRIHRDLEIPAPLYLVDTRLTPLVPEAVVARKFFSRKETIDLRAGLTKTQEAESRHQAILRDISRFLLSKGVQPLESRSLDIAYWNSKKLFLAEVKSATDANFLDQSRRGIIQLLEYKLAFEQDGFHVGNMTIFIEAIQDPMSMLYARKLASYANIELLIYDNKVAWPDRVERINEVMLYAEKR